MTLDAEETQEMRELTHSILMKSGSTGGNKSLFVNPSQQLAKLGGSSSPLGMAASSSSNGFLNMTDPGATADY